MSAKVTIIGNLGRDPETRINANNTFIANFSIAVNNKRKTATGEEIKKTDWYNITATGKQAQTIAKNVRKGEQLYVEGRQTFNDWTDREGNARRTIEVFMQDFQFMGRNRSDEAETAPGAAAASAIPDDIREAMNAPDDLDFSGDNFPSVM